MFVISYDPITFARKNVMTKIKSATWTKRFYDVGSFEIHLQNGVFEKNDIIKHGDNCGIVMEIENNYPDGAVIYGYDLKGIATFRYITEEITYTQKTPEYIIKDLCTKCLTTGERAVMGLNIAENLDRGVAIDFSAEKRLSEVLREIALQSDIGFDVGFDESKLTLDILRTRDNTDLIFARRFKNIESMSYTQSVYDAYNVLYSKNTDGVVVSSGETAGILRREGYTDKAEEMQTFLSDNAETESIFGNANTKLRFGADYMLGDYVTVELGELYTIKLVSEVQLEYTSTGQKIYPTFGQERDNPIKKLLRK